MDQITDVTEPADAAALAFEGLRREVALLNLALGGLAAERASAPDYSEALGEIALLSTQAADAVGKLMASPALRHSPAEVGRQIIEAGTEATRRERAALREAGEVLERAASDLRGWIATARQSRAQNRRLAQVGVAALIGGAILGASVPGVIANVVPERWVWPEKMAAGLLHRDLWSAGERLLSVADPERWRRLQAPSDAPARDPAPMDSHPRQAGKSSAKRHRSAARPSEESK